MDIDELAQILRALLYLCIICTPVTAAILELSRLAVLLIYLSMLMARVPELKPFDDVMRQLITTFGFKNGQKIN